MKRIKNLAIKIICVGVVLVIMTLGLFAGCGNQLLYNAVLYSNAKEWMNEEFLKKNLTRGSQYVNEEGEIVSADGESYLETKTFIIQSNEDFNEIFTEFPPEIDFEKDMILIYIFTTTTGIQPYDIKNVNLDGSIVKIECKLKRYSGIAKDSLSAPGQRCLVIKMDKLDITSVEFIRK